jgi:hypothetical protein
MFRVQALFAKSNRLGMWPDCLRASGLRCIQRESGDRRRSAHSHLHVLPELNALFADVSVQ